MEGDREGKSSGHPGMEIHVGQLGLHPCQSGPHFLNRMVEPIHVDHTMATEKVLQQLFHSNLACAVPKWHLAPPRPCTPTVSARTMPSRAVPAGSIVPSAATGGQHPAPSAESALCAKPQGFF